MTDAERQANAKRLREWRQRKRAEYLAANGEPPRRGRPAVAPEIQKQKRAEREKRYQEKKRLEAPPKPQKLPQPPKKPIPKEQKKEQPVSTSVTPASNYFPSDDVVAAALNQQNKFSTILAVAQADDCRKSVILERFRTELGFHLFRLKCTNYRFFKTKAEALQAAKKEATGMRLNLYSSLSGSADTETDEDEEDTDN